MMVADVSNFLAGNIEIILVMTGHIVYVTYWIAKIDHRSESYNLRFTRNEDEIKRIAERQDRAFSKIYDRLSHIDSRLSNIEGYLKQK